MARQILNYLKMELLPDAVNMVGGWGLLNPATRTCFQRFFDAVALSADTWEQILTVKPPGYGMLVIYSDVDNTSIEIDGEFKGYAGQLDPLKVKLQEGKHEVIAKAEGYQVNVKHYTVKEGEVLTVKLDMVKLKES